MQEKGEAAPSDQDEQSVFTQERGSEMQGRTSIWQSRNGSTVGGELSRKSPAEKVELSNASILEKARSLIQKNTSPNIKRKTETMVL